jgi:hypothetical protein
MNRHIRIAAAVLLPPTLGCAALLSRVAPGDRFFLGNFAILAAAGLLWWPFSIFTRAHLFWGGLIGIQTSMALFVGLALCIRLGGLGWVFFPAFQIVGLAIGVCLSLLGHGSKK